jgi:hypothetical protein
MADTIRYFGDPVPATYPNGEPIIVNGRRLLIPQNFDLQTQINAASNFKSPQRLDSLWRWLWFLDHFPPGSSGDPQRRAGYSGGFDPRYTDAGNYGYGLSAAAAGFSLDEALKNASGVNQLETGKSIPSANAGAIRQAYDDYAARRFPDIDHEAGKAYSDSVRASDFANAVPFMVSEPVNKLARATAAGLSHLESFVHDVPKTDEQRYAKAHWGDLNSPDAKEFMANFQQAFGGYPQHVDVDQLQPLPADGRIPSGKDVSLFVGRNGEVLTYARPPAPGGTGALRGIYGLDGGPNGAGSTGLDFFRDGPRDRRRSGLTRRPPTIRLAESMSLCRTVPRSTGGTIQSTDSSEGSRTMPIPAVATIRPRNDLGMSPPMLSQCRPSARRLPTHLSLIPVHRPCRLLQPPILLLRNLLLKDRFGNRAPFFQPARRFVPFFRCLLRSLPLQHNRTRAAAAS